METFLTSTNLYKLYNEGRFAHPAAAQDDNFVLFYGDILNLC